jgi:hypothetical protein
MAELNPPPTPVTSWSVLNSPFVIALLTSGFLAALGATYNNRLERDARLEANQKEVAAAATEVRLRAMRLEAVDVAILRTPDEPTRRALGDVARLIIAGQLDTAISQPQFRGVHMSVLVDRAAEHSDEIAAIAVQGRLAIVDSASATAAEQLRQQMPVIRAFARKVYVQRVLLHDYAGHGRRED